MQQGYRVRDTGGRTWTAMLTKVAEGYILWRTHSASTSATLVRCLRTVQTHLSVGTTCARVYVCEGVELAT